jgi:hypothetical protein
MKLYNQLKYMGVALLGVMALASCSDDNDWQAGENYEVKNQIVVSGDDSDGSELFADVPTTFTVTFSREDANGALSAPLTYKGSELFSGPSTVDFADGEKTSSVEVAFKGSSTYGSYTCDVAVAYGEYNNPYSVESNMFHFEAMVGEWQFYKNAVIYNDDLQKYYGFPDINCELEHFLGSKLYRFKDFAKDYDLVFRLDGNGSIIPRGGSYYYSNYWYFSENLWYEEAPLIFAGDTTHKLTYAYLYLGGYSYMNLDEDYGYLYLGQGFWTSIADEEDYTQIDWQYLSVQLK